MPQTRVAVIGAGLAGLACAQSLRRADAAVVVFEKSRGIGGRLATRRIGDLAFDHGAQYLTARASGFREYLESAYRSGRAAGWTPALADGAAALATDEAWHVGVPGMAAVVRPLAEELELELGAGIVDLRRGAEGWQLETGAGRDTRAFDAVVLAIPAPQARALLEGLGTRADALADDIATVSLTPTWTALLAFEQPSGIEADVLQGSPAALAWAARDSSKPGRTRRVETWVLHAGSEWSSARLESGPAALAPQFLQSFATLIGRQVGVPGVLQLHRWRHARVERALGRPCLYDPALGLGVCGDWCIAPRAEAAYDSGIALARELVEHFNLPRRLPPP